MKARKQTLILEQVDKKILPFKSLIHINVPENGWINATRQALNISLKQLGRKMDMTPQAVRALEKREKAGTISLRSLRAAALAMEMKLVYGPAPEDGSLEKLVVRKAGEMAKTIVNRTSQSMLLEDQENSKERILKAYEEKKNELKNEIPKFLWD
jgi:predicted DNA-binding mobile mystery protein A